MSDLIEQIANACGIANDYIDAAGKPVVISRECKLQCLKALGYNVDDQASLEEQFIKEQESFYKAGCEPVLVSQVDTTLKFTLALSDEEFAGQISYDVVAEDGAKSSGTLLISPVSKHDTRLVDGVEISKYDVSVPVALPLGYHDITFTTVTRKLSTIRLIITPKSCYKPDPIKNGTKVWGPSVQLYTLRSERNWGIGDFNDLTDLIENLASYGAGFVGINPIHAAYPANPNEASPYSPSSRRWLNVIYISVPSVPEYASCDAAKEFVESPEVVEKLNALRDLEYVDYKSVMELKLKALRIIFENSKIEDKRTKRGNAFIKFCEEGGQSLVDMATYDALMNSFYQKGENAWGWPVWADEFKNAESEAVKAWAKENESEVKFYKYLQFLADEQLGIADKTAKERGMAVGIYRDLAVGVSSGSEEIWANGRLYCQEASVGAPPDPLGPLGQNWGLPPMNPTKLIEAQYQPIIDLFRANMRHCGSLRIDHAMSLLRLWWVPPMAPASQGVYVYYKVHDLVGILALESHRNKSLIIGEDLGTVPAEMKTILREAGIHSYKIFFWEKSETDGGFISPKDYVEQAMSALSTHDMATIEGWWSHYDLQLGRELGLYNDDQVREIGEGRYLDQQRILDSMHWHKVISDNVPTDGRNCPMSKELRNGMQIHMCLGNCALFSTQIEDWLGMQKPVNIPGTSSEYPNWRRKLSKNIKEIFADTEVQELLTKMTQARLSVSK
jgi:4-alpha-glucanotransferase